ncbi:MAG TPA: lysylphosphatidylglycerol synthase transmembrane domain-containing protein [Chloroflexia bacterium]|nr:lysylphosphatidylglycerol synthase transmembrane domain-containing protein [Chloroflexia bacterium]
MAVENVMREEEDENSAAELFVLPGKVSGKRPLSAPLADSGEPLDDLEFETPAEAESEAEVDVPALSLKARLFDLKTIAGFVLSLGIIVFFVMSAKINFGEIWNNILRVQPLWMLGAFAIYYAAFLARGMRWRMLLRNAGFEKEHNVRLPGLPTLIEIIFLSWFVNCLVPAKLGDAYRGYLLKKNANASFSRTLGTIFAERIADVLVLFGLLCLGGLVAFSNVESKMSSISLVFIFGLVLVAAIIFGLIALRFWSHQIEKIIPARFRTVFHHFRQGTVSSFHRSTQLELYAFTLIIWVCEGARLYMVLQGLNIVLPLSVVIFIALASSLLTTIPFTPAGLGAVEGTMVFVLTTFAVEKNLAGSVAILDRVISYWSIIVFGALLYIFSKKK